MLKCQRIQGHNGFHCINYFYKKVILDIMIGFKMNHQHNVCIWNPWHESKCHLLPFKHSGWMTRVSKVVLYWLTYCLSPTWYQALTQPNAALLMGPWNWSNHNRDIIICIMMSQYQLNKCKRFFQQTCLNTLIWYFLNFFQPSDTKYSSQTTRARIIKE